MHLYPGSGVDPSVLAPSPQHHPLLLEQDAAATGETPRVMSGGRGPDNTRRRGPARLLGRILGVWLEEGNSHSSVVSSKLSRQSEGSLDRTDARTRDSTWELVDEFSPADVMRVFSAADQTPLADPPPYLSGAGLFW
ncbi:hypothetical protein NDU88_001005 [Pleurodeles waltl]|uniref:Uncharacterized protein n=1 Tax=Pleurodeles waltl TaxID=8319 RepID=A0AAV7U542_PLEWA|nr:hypothetical protein NDU88_001005 [Pleurodeles waltl]